MPLTTDNILVLIQILTFGLGVIVLYHLVFVVVNVRKIVRRVDHVTKQAEDIILKPINMADVLVEWLVDLMEEQQKKKGKSGNKKLISGRKK